MSLRSPKQGCNLILAVEHCGHAYQCSWVNTVQATQGRHLVGSGHLVGSHLDERYRHDLRCKLQ